MVIFRCVQLLPGVHHHRCSSINSPFLCNLAGHEASMKGDQGKFMLIPSVVCVIFFCIERFVMSWISASTMTLSAQQMPCVLIVVTCDTTGGES